MQGKAWSGQSARLYPDPSTPGTAVLDIYPDARSCDRTRWESDHSFGVTLFVPWPRSEERAPLTGRTFRDAGGDFTSPVSGDLEWIRLDDAGREGRVGVRLVSTGMVELDAAGEVDVSVCAPLKR